MSTVGYATLQIIPSLRGMQGKLAEELNIDQPAEKAGTSAGGKLSGALGKVLKTSVVAVGAAAGGALGTALFKGWNRLTAIENATAKLTGLGHSAASVKSIMDNALASVKGTAFGLDEAASVSAMAVAAGIKPGQQLEGVLKTVADTATIAGASMSDMGMIFGSVAARGKLQGDDLLQLQARGVPVLQFLAKHYGITAQAASDMVSKGKVDFANFNAAMTENLGGAALKSGETTKGALANMGAAAGRFGASLLQGVFPVTKKVFGGVTKFLDDATAKMKPFVEAFSTWITTKVVPAAESLLGKVGQLGDKVRTFFDSTAGQQLKTDTMDKLGSIFDKLSSAGEKALPAIKDIAESLGKASGAVGISTWQLLLDTLDILAGVLDTVLVPALRTLGDWMKDHQGTVTAVVAAYTGWKIGSVATDVAKSTAEIVKNTKAWAANAIASAKAAPGKLSSAWDTLRLRAMFAGDAVKGAGSKIASASKAALTGAANLAKLAAGYLKAGVEAAASAVKQLAVAAAQKAVAAGQAIVSAATKVWTGIQAAFNLVMSMNPVALIVIGIMLLVGAVILAYKNSETFRDIVDAAFRAVGAAGKWLWENAIKPAWEGIKLAFEVVGAVISWWWNNIVTPAFNAVASIAGWLWGKISAYFGFWKGVFDNVKSWIGSAKDWIVDKFNSLVDFVTGLPGRIGRAASGMWDGIKNAFRSAINWLIDKWNGLHLSIPSIDTHIPGIGKIGGFTLHTDNIPRLAEGGIIPATPGGRIVRVAEAGQAEAVVPLDRLDRMLRGRGDDRPPVTQNFYVQNVDERAVAMMSARRLAAVVVR